MTKSKTSIVVTSIFSPNESLRTLAAGAVKEGWDFFIVGDTKTPPDFQLPGADYYDVETQKRLDFKLAPICPERHYTRKNLGYLLAIRKGCEIIVETDDDNIPADGFWEPRNKVKDAVLVKGKGWVNVYDFFSNSGTWPRGLPLENILSNEKPVIGPVVKEECPIQQGLADGNPDVDAVYRMTRPLPITFDKRSYPIKIQKGLWSPFNSQNTTWFKEAFPLMYLPSFCTFRMTDIWRSWIAQRIAWECDWELLFHNATVFQERNEHSLLRDFELEVPGYLLNNTIKQILEDLPLQRGTSNIGNNLIVCYEALVEHKIITDRKELDLLQAWLSDIQQFS